MTSRSFFIFALATVLGGCGGSSSGVGSGSEPSIVGTWGLTTTVAQGAASRVEETYLVYGADKTVRDFVRSAATDGNVTTSTSHCGSGTYVFANGVLSTTIQENSEPPVPPGTNPGTPTTITKTVTGSSKVEFVGESMRLTSDVDGSSNVAVYSRGTLPDGLEASCPK